jgi:hypothetical protein
VTAPRKLAHLKDVDCRRVGGMAATVLPSSKGRLPRCSLVSGQRRRADPAIRQRPAMTESPGTVQKRKK